MFLVNTDQSHLSQIWSYLDLLLRFQFLNKGAALVHVYTDGSVLVTHGGTELGQGLHTKMVQVWSILMQVNCISLQQGTALYFIKLLHCSRLFSEDPTITFCPHAYERKNAVIWIHPLSRRQDLIDGLQTVWCTLVMTLEFSRREILAISMACKWLETVNQRYSQLILF